MKIFCFPYVVINEIMKHLKPVERISLSLCSKNANAFVKTYSNTGQDLSITLSDEDQGYSVSCPGELLILMLSERPTCLETSDLMTARGFEYGFTEHGQFIICCDDFVQGCQEITNYICDLFKTSVTNITITREESQWLLDFAQRRQEQPLKKVFAWLSDMNAQGYSRLMSCNVTELLDCGMVPPDNYRFDAKLPAVKKLIITKGFWITRENLLGLESHIAYLSYTQLTSSDINALLRSWLNKRLSKLKFLRIYGRIPDNQIYEGIHDRLEPAQREISYNWDDDVRPFQFNTNTFHIRRDDGVVATVTFNGRLSVMAVWPDLDGNRV